ncbi:MAG: hypothetical protein LBN94_03395 [Puniceicoccales bacterium]|jgi:peptidyl-prolyl cis-trans isomerase D|nr:hypothetical protein [Puniceicoccales bacterium]
MISLLQRILQKHHKWLFSILLLIVTISFVFTVGSSPGIGRNTHRQERKFFGHNLSSPKDTAKILEEIDLSIQLRRLFIPIPQLKDYMLFSRLAALKLADDLRIPRPNKNVLDHFLESYPLFLGKDRQFDGNKYNRFLEKFEENPSHLGLFERTISNDFRIAIVEESLSRQGYCLEEQARSILRKELTRYSFLRAKFDGLILGNETPPYTAGELEQYFEEHRDNYRIGEQIILDYVEFPRELFRGKIPEPSPLELQQFHREHGNQFKDLEEGSEALRKALTEAYEEEQISKLAMEAADQFIYQLYENNIPHDSQELRQFIEGKSLHLETMEALVLGEFPENQYFSKETLSQGSKLNGEHYFSDPVYGKNGNVYILLYKDMIPSLYPPFDGVRERVIADFLVEKKEANFTEQMNAIHRLLGATGNISRNDFEQIVADKSGSFDAWQGQKIDRLFPLSPEEKEALIGLSPNGISPLIFKGKMEATIIFLEEKNVPTTIETASIDGKVMALEKENRKIFDHHLIEMILDEMAIKDNREEIEEEFQTMANFIAMQLSFDS